MDGFYPGGPLIAGSMVVYGSLVRALDVARAAGLPVTEDRCLAYPVGDGPSAVEMTFALPDGFLPNSAYVWPDGIEQLASALPKAIAQLRADWIRVIITGAQGLEGEPPRRKFIIDQPGRIGNLKAALLAIPAVVEEHVAGVYRWDPRARAWTGGPGGRSGGTGVREPRRPRRPEMGDGAAAVPPPGPWHPGDD